MKELVEKYKYPLIVIALGLMLLVVPENGNTVAAETQDILMQQVLSCTRGVGKAQVISSENGVVICCEGADNAKVRLDIIKAVSSYTGFGSDKITILKLVK